MSTIPNLGRSLPAALGHVFANAALDDPRMPALMRLFNSLSSADCMTCRWEIFETKAAMRGERKARII